MYSFGGEKSKSLFMARRQPFLSSLSCTTHRPQGGRGNDVFPQGGISDNLTIG